jgi:hypothetical protein
MVVYHDHSPGSYRKYSYRDFLKFIPWAIANHLIPDLPPSQVNLQITPHNSIYPSPYYLLPNQDLSRLLINPFIQLSLGSGVWLFRFYFSGIASPIEFEVKASTDDPASFSIFRLFLVRAPFDTAAWLWGYVVDGQPITFLTLLDNIALTHFFIAGPPQATSPIGNLDVHEYCLMVPVIVAPTIFS